MSKRKWTNEKIISTIRSLHDEGVYLGSRNIQRLHKALHTASKTYLGSWRNAVELSGYNYEEILNESEVVRRTNISSSKLTKNIITTNGVHKFIDYKGVVITVDLDFDIKHGIVVVAGYPLVRTSKSYIKLHNYVMNHIPTKGGDIVDHINRNPLDNRKCNLRIIPQGNNCKNRAAKGYTLVGNKYLTQLSVDGNKIYLGLWDTKEEAQLVYRMHYLALNGEYSPKEYECVHDDIKSTPNNKIISLYDELFPEDADK